MKMLKKVIGNRKFWRIRKITYLCSVRKNKSINRSTWNNKNLKIMAATSWTIIRRNKKTGKIVMCNLDVKWTYKTALGIAIETTINETHDLICVVETNKILLKDEKENEKNCAL